MNNPPVRRRSFAAVAACALGLSLAAPAGSRAAITVNPSTLGNVFYTTETVSIPLHGSVGTSIAYTVTDYFNNQVATGTVPLTGGNGTLTPTIVGGKIGYFDVALTENPGGAAATTTFAILTPIDVSTMGSSPFGVDTLFSQGTSTALAPLIARAGIAQIRDEQYWASIEAPAGTYNFSDFTGYMSAAATAHLSPLITLDWSNKYYDYEELTYTLPHSTNGVLGYTNYANQLLAEYPGQISNVEVWNEPNGGVFALDPSGVDVTQTYANLVKSVHNAIKPTYPSVNILAGAVVPVAIGFVKQMILDGATPDYFDRVSCHPYRDVPEGLDRELYDLDSVIAVYNHQKSMLLVATEFDLSVTSESGRKDEAAFVPRVVTTMLSTGLMEKMYYFLWQDSATFPYTGLIGEGSVGNVPNPVYVAYANVIRQLYGWTYGSRATSGLATTTYAYCFSKSGQTKWVCWGITPSTVSIAIVPATATLTDTMGNATTLTASGGKVTFPVGVDAAYLTVNDGTVGAVTEAANPVLAQSVGGYDKTQGLHNWRYGYATVSGAYSTGLMTDMTYTIWGDYNLRWMPTNGSLTPYQQIDEMAPGGGNTWCVRRWGNGSSPVTVTISGSVQTPDTTGNGVTFQLFVNGTQTPFQVNGSGPLVNSVSTYKNAGVFSFSAGAVNLPASALVDFTVSGNNNSYTYDATKFVGQITKN